MTIGIDGRFYSESGVGRYIRNLISNLQLLDKKNEYFIFMLSKDLPLFSDSKNFKKNKADFSWYGIAEQVKFPKLLEKYKLDLMHFPHFNVPIFYSGKFVVTIHDLIHQHYQMKRATTLNPITFKLKQLGYGKVFKHAVNKSCEIMVPSNSVKQLLFDEWKVDLDKIIVTPEAVDSRLLTIARKNPPINAPYIFYVGNAHPHKNVEGLIMAFLELKKENNDLQLVLSGASSYFWQNLKKQYPLPGIIYTGAVNDEELVGLYKNARVFVMPSFEEGFGLSILEAMALGCPVVASNTASLPEVGGNAAVYFNPGNLGDMVNKINQVLKNKGLRDQLIEKGRKRYKEFSWEKLAKQTLEVYTKCG